MKSSADKIKSIITWIEQGLTWTKIRKCSGNPSPGSYGANKIIGYLLPRDDADGDIIIIYHCVVSSHDSDIRNEYQLSSLPFTVWVEHMQVSHT